MTATQTTTLGRRPNKSPTTTRPEFGVRDLMFAVVRRHPAAVAGTRALARKHLGASLGLLLFEQCRNEGLRLCRTCRAGIGSSRAALKSTPVASEQ
jgi:hypothetical protein